MTSYKKMEEVIKTINSEFISLKTEEVAHNNDLLKSTLEQMISVMKRDAIFKAIYEQPFYGGSFYDDLKVGNPDEFDLHLLLVLPKFCEKTKTKKCDCIKIAVSNKPGFVWFQMKKDHCQLFNRFIEDGYVRTDLILDWFKGRVVNALNSFKNSSGFTIRPLYESESGPAITIGINGKFGHFDVDIVPAFKWDPEQWLPTPFRPNPSKRRTHFFTVPKKAKDMPRPTRYWRTSFQDQERELIEGKQFLKPALRLLKKMRNNLEHALISSYALKNIVLWELDSDFFKQSNTLSDTFMRLLEKYKECLGQKKIDNYWNKKDNLLRDIGQATLVIHYNEIVRKVNEINRSYQADPFVIAKVILKAGTGDYNRFMEKYKPNL